MDFINFLQFFPTILLILLLSCLFQSVSLLDFLTKPKPTEPIEGAIVDLGSIEIPNAECDQAITTHLQQCKDNYHEKIKSVAEKFGNDFRTESVKKASCCGIWETKKCAIKASQQLKECDDNITMLYEQLPSDPKIRSNVFDKCSEYMENSAVCQEESRTSAFSMNSLITILVILIVISIVVLLVVKFIHKRSSDDKYMSVARA